MTLTRETCYIYTCLLTRATLFGAAAIDFARAGNAHMAKAYATSAAESYFATHGR